MNKAKKAIFGGTFDPIHNGHLYIANEALNILKLDKVIFVPSGNPPHKTEKRVTDSSIRYELVKMAIRDEKFFDVSDYEIRKEELSYTYKTLQFFKRLEPDTEWYFLTGTDCLMELHLWKNVKEIMELCKFAVFNRSGYNHSDVQEKQQLVEKKYGKDIIMLDLPALNISSTLIRNKVLTKESIEYLVPNGVANAIKELRLYD